MGEDRYIQLEELLEIVEELGLRAEVIEEGCEWGVGCWKVYEISGRKRALFTVADDGEVILEPNGERMTKKELRKVLEGLR